MALVGNNFFSRVVGSPYKFRSLYAVVAINMGCVCLARSTMVRCLSMYACFVISSFMLSGLWEKMDYPSMSPQSFPITTYQKVIGTGDGRSCHSYPVCSVYARQAFNEYGFVFGSWLMLDRLIHENDDLVALHSNKQVIVFDGEARLNDPLYRNAGWLHH